MYGCVAVLSDRRVALIAAILMAAYHFHIHWSRLALNNISDTLWVPATIGLYAWGWKNRNSAGADLAGATLGFSQYFYQGGRLGVLLLAFVVVWLWWNDRDGQRLVIHLGKLAAVAVCIVGPLFLFAIAEPEPFLARFEVVLGWQPDAIRQATGSATDYWQFFWYQLARSVGAYTAYTDITGFYRPQIPLTIGLSMIMLPIGFGWAIVKRMWVPVVWLILATFFGGFLLGGAPSSSHYVIAIPAICWLIAIAIDLIGERGHPRVALAILVIILLTDLIFYFGIYLSAPVVRSDAAVSADTSSKPVKQVRSAESPLRSAEACATIAAQFSSGDRHAQTLVRRPDFNRRCAECAAVRVDVSAAIALARCAVRASNTRREPRQPLPRSPIGPLSARSFHRRLPRRPHRRRPSRRHVNCPSLTPCLVLRLGSCWWRRSCSPCKRKRALAWNVGKIAMRAFRMRWRR